MSQKHFLYRLYRSIVRLVNPVRLFGSVAFVNVPCSMFHLGEFLPSYLIIPSFKSLTVLFYFIF